MKSLTDILFGSKRERTKKEAETKFQITEYDGKLWLTVDNTLVCPDDMFCYETITTLTEIRRLYVERTAPEHG